MSGTGAVTHLSSFASTCPRAQPPSLPGGQQQRQQQVQRQCALVFTHSANRPLTSVLGSMYPRADMPQPLANCKLPTPRVHYQPPTGTNRYTSHAPDCPCSRPSAYLPSLLKRPAPSSQLTFCTPPTALYPLLGIRQRETSANCYTPPPSPSSRPGSAPAACPPTPRRRQP